MEKLKITQTRSLIKIPARQKATMLALKLGKISWFVELEANPTNLGMINKVRHLVKIEKI